MKGTNKLVWIVAFLLLVLGIMGYLIFVKKQKTPTDLLDNFRQNKTSENYSTTENGSLLNSNKILIQTNDGYSLVDVTTGQATDAPAIERGDFSDFQGMPAPDSNKKESSDDSVVLFSLNKNKVILVHSVIINATDAEIESGMQPSVVNSGDYVCELATKKCEKTELLSTSYQGIDSTKKEGKYVVWTNWDSNKNILFGHIGSDNGDNSPVYKCDTSKKICQKTEGYDSLVDGEVRANVPQGAFSRSMNKFAMIAQNDVPDQQTGAKWDFLLYSSDDLSKPLKNFDISVIIDRGELASYDSVYSLAWSGDEKKVAIATTGRIFMLNLESGSLELLYLTPETEEDSIYLDGGALAFSSDDKYLVFVQNFDKSAALFTDDSEDEIEDSAQGDIVGTLKKIDLTKGNEISDVFVGNELQLEIL